MALEDIIKKILAEAEKKAQTILSQARQEADQLQKQAQTRGDNISQEIIQGKEAQARQEAIHILSFARLEARNAVLAFKQNLLSQVFFHQQVLKLIDIDKELILPDRKRQKKLDPRVYSDLLRRSHEAKLAEILFAK